MNGRPPEGVRYTRAMLRTMLEDRFKLRTHIETRAQPVYALIIARTDGSLGPQLTRSVQDCGPVTPPVSRCTFTATIGETAGRVRLVGQPMESLTAFLSSVAVDRLVLDRTGLTGTFDSELHWALDQAPSAVAPASSNDVPAIFMALREQLGLKLEPQRGPVDVVVIDSIERRLPD